MYWRVMEYIGDFTSVLPPVLLTAAVYALLRRLWLRRRGLSRKSRGEEFARLLLVCWLAGLLALVWTPGNFWIKLRNRVGHGIPMELGDWLFQGDFSFEITVHQQFARMLAGGSWQTAANMVMYLPLGVLLPLVWKDARWYRVTAAGLALSLVTELVQPVVGRSFDVDDLIANTLGTLVGYGVFAAGRCVLRRASRR